MSSAAASNNLAGLRFGELASAWQAVAAGHAHGGQQQRDLFRAGLGEQKQKVTAPAAAAGAATVAAGRKAAAEDGDGGVGRCGGAMSDTTHYLLLDRFTPS
ncbi:unnamed protein product [Urochloa humidicola]